MAVHTISMFIQHERPRHMNNDILVPSSATPGSVENDLVHGALRAAAERTSLQLSAVELSAGTREGHHARDNARLMLDLNGTVQPYLVVARTRLRGREELDAIARQNHRAGLPILLVTPHLTSALAEECVRLDLQFIDLAGNLHLRAPGQYVLVVGRGPNEQIRRMRRTGGQSVTSASVSALRMIFGILCEAELVNRPYREIAAAAGVALGTVGPVLDDLRERRLLTGKEGRHGRRLLDPAALREEWLTNYPIRLRPKLRIQRFSAPDPSWWERAEIPAGEGWWGGEVAVWKTTRQLRPSMQTLYVASAARPDVIFDLVKRHRLRADESGTLEILDTFWDFGEKTAHTINVPPLLIYADLTRTREPRNLEAATLIREQWSL
jgi:hypothetical protein